MRCGPRVWHHMCAETNTATSCSSSTRQQQKTRTYHGTCGGVCDSGGCCSSPKLSRPRGSCICDAVASSCVLLTIVHSVCCSTFHTSAAGITMRGNSGYLRWSTTKTTTTTAAAAAAAVTLVLLICCTATTEAGMCVHCAFGLELGECGRHRVNGLTDHIRWQASPLTHTHILTI